MHGHYMKAGGHLGDKYPEALFADQKGALEDDIAHQSIDDPDRAQARENRLREAFADGRLVFLDRRKFGNALVDAKGELNVKQVHDHEWLEVDTQEHFVAIGRAKDGWFALQPEAARVVADLMRRWDDD